MNNLSSFHNNDKKNVGNKTLEKETKMNITSVLVQHVFLLIITNFLTTKENKIQDRSKKWTH